MNRFKSRVQLGRLGQRARTRRVATFAAAGLFVALGVANAQHVNGRVRVQAVPDPSAPTLSRGMLDAIERGMGTPCRTWTSESDFAEGFSFNLDGEFDPATGEFCLKLKDDIRTWPFIAVANSERGTIARIAVDNSLPGVNQGDVVGEYWTAPMGRRKNPSRTTVDAFGNMWVGNRAEGPTLGSNNPLLYGGPHDNLGGSVTRVGLAIGGTRGDKVPDGLGGFTVIPNPLGEYLDGPFTYCTCEDQDGDGLIRTSRGYTWNNGVADYQNTILQWDSGLSGGDDPGGVTLADDECITAYVRTTPTAIRHVSVDANGNVWVGSRSYWAQDIGENGFFELIDGATATVVPSSAFFSTSGGYGGFVHKSGDIWSANWYAPGVGRLGWIQGATPPTTDLFIPSYGIAVDPDTNHVWTTTALTDNTVRVVDHTTGGQIASYDHVGFATSNRIARGIAIHNGNVWVAHTSTNTVGRLTTTGTHLGNVVLGVNPSGNVPGSNPHGVAVDSNFKVWAVNRVSNNAMRIDPTTPPGAVDLVVDLGDTALPYNYSDMTGAAMMNSLAPQGQWTTIHDGGKQGCQWGALTYNAIVDPGASISVWVRATDSTGPNSGPWTVVQSNVPFSGVTGRYLEIRVIMQRPPKSNAQVRLCDITVCKLNDCMAVENEMITCTVGPDGQPVMTYTADITNLSGVPASWLLLTPQATGVTINPASFLFFPTPLGSGDTTTVSVNITGHDPTQPVCFYVTLLSPQFEVCCSRLVCIECPTEPELCATIEPISIECVPGAANTYSYTFNLTNDTADVIQHYHMLPQPPFVNITPIYVPLNPPLQPNETRMLKVLIQGPDARPGARLCFDVTLHDQTYMLCCYDKHCVVLPECDTGEPNESCHLTKVSWCCFPKAIDTNVVLTVCNNNSTQVKEYDWSVQSVQGAACSAVLSPGCISPDSGLLIIPPGECRSVTLTINCDCIYGAGQNASACLLATITNIGSGNVLECEGIIRTVSPPLPVWCFRVADPTLPHVLPMLAQKPVSVPFEITNIGAPAGAINYRFVSTDPRIRLNGRPGATDEQTAHIAVGSSLIVLVEVMFDEDIPFNINDVVLLADAENDSYLLPAASIGVRSVASMPGYPCPGDTNGDGVVDFIDFSVVLVNYGQSGPDIAGDTNGDGVIDFVDFSMVLNNYGAVCKDTP